MKSIVDEYLDLLGKNSARKGKNCIVVDSVKNYSPFCFKGEGPYTFTKDCRVVVKGVRFLESDGKEHPFVLTCDFKSGFVTDGASVPLVFRGLVPCIKKDDDLYNAAPFIHDGLYMLKGAIGGEEELVREECDDILRGIWRLAGMERWLAAFVDEGVHVFAGGKSHWGNDSDDNMGFFKAFMDFHK